MTPSAIAKTIVSFLVVSIVGLPILFGSWYTIDQSERGVRTRNGAVTGIATPGLEFKMPWIEDVTKISIKTVTYNWADMDTYSFDQQPAHMKVSVTLHAEPTKVGELYAKFGTLDAAVKQRISPVVAQQIKIVFGKYTAIRAVQDRARLNADIKAAILETLGSDPIVNIEAIQLEDITFSGAYLKSIEDRMLAEVEVQKLQQNAEREKVQALIVVTQANAQANAVRERAKAEADAITLRGDAEANAIKARGAALRENKGLVELQAVEKWDGKLPVTMVPGSTVPFIGVK